MSGYFFGENRELDINHFALNVIDTPGFADNDINDRRENAQKISQSLDVGINAFIYVIAKSHVKMAGDLQDNLQYMHEWTQGAIWKNLIFLIRQEFSRTSIEDRANDNESFWTIYQKTDSAKETLANAAVQRNWTIMENGKLRFLEKVFHCFYKLRFNETMIGYHDQILKFTLDYKFHVKNDMNIRFLPFDASQTADCDGIIKSPDCHEMPIWENEINEDNFYDIQYPDKDDYHEYFDYTKYESKPKFWSERTKKY